MARFSHTKGFLSHQRGIKPARLQLLISRNDAGDVMTAPEAVLLGLKVSNIGTKALSSVFGSVDAQQAFLTCDFRGKPSHSRD